MSTNQNVTTKTKTILWRGIKGRCPNCGHGKLFKSYITPNKSCSVCHEDLSHIRADDAPPWLTILITGHIMAPLMLYLVEHEIFSNSVTMAILLTMGLLCTLLLLPLSKGFFIAAIWLTQKK